MDVFRLLPVRYYSLEPLQHCSNDGEWMHFVRPKETVDAANTTHRHRLMPITDTDHIETQLFRLPVYWGIDTAFPPTARSLRLSTLSRLTSQP